MMCIRAVAAGLLLVSACQNPEQEPTGTGTVRTTVSGSVIRSDDSAPVPGAIVRDMSLASRRDTTDANGQYSIGFDLTSGQNYTTSLIASFSPGFGDDTVAVTLIPGRDTTITLTLTADSTSPVTGTTSGEAAGLVLVGNDVTSISIRGTGVNESALLTFEARDSLGNPILGSNGPIVKFAIIGGPNGGEYVFPISARVNGTSGRVSTRINSGTLPGVIQVQASTRNDSVLSAPARLTIASGPPDGNNASISRAKANIPGGLFDNERVQISVILGDRFQNPVPAGTAVYFTTTGGLIQPTGFTDQDGIASVELISANPRPVGGVAFVTARTIGDTAVRKSDSLIQRTTKVVFSGAARIIAPTAAFAISDSGTYPFAFQVQDINGNPLSESATIKVSLSGPASSELQITGDVDVTLKDTDDTTATNYTAKISDRTRGGLSGVVTVTIEVKGRNGEAFHQFSGLLSSTGGGGGLPGSTSTPRSIALVNISSRTLSVKGTGANESSRLVFVVRDSLGNPVGNPLDPTQKAYVTFSINPPGGLGGGEFVYPVGDSTDFNGQVGVTFNAGTQAGVLQIVARTLVTGVGSISASPVQLTIQGGLPDSTRFYVGIDKVNMPGLAKAGPLGTVSVQAADQFGNPVQTGTAIYFSTSLGNITASATTGESGQASSQLSGGVAVATNGQGLITVQTVGKNGEAIRKQLPFLFTGAPLITRTPISGFVISDSGSYTFSFKVADANGNPLSSGAAVNVTKEGAGSGELELTGTVTRVFPDTRDTNYTNFTVTAADKSNGGSSGPVTFLISVTGENGTTSYAFSGTQLAAGQTASSVGVRRVATLELLSSSSSSVSIRGTGSRESASLTFIAKDSLGRAIDGTGRAYVRFALAPAGGLGGGEFLSPLADSTNDNGLVTVTYNAGTTAGVIQVMAKTTAPGRADTIYSSPVRLTVYGGLPDPNQVIVGLSRVNIPGLVKSGPLATVFVQAGDKYNNPAQTGTAFYFTTSLGLIQASATTNDGGQASAQLSGGVVGASNGQGSVTVSTVGENGVAIAKSLPFLFTGAPLITGAPGNGFAIADSGSYGFSFKVADLNGNPLSEGTSITVTAEGAGSSDLQLTGTTSRTMPDTRDTNFTNFSVLAQDRSSGGVSGAVTFRITVSGESGNVSTTISGSQLAAGQIVGTGATRRVASLELASSSTTALSIRGTGAKESATLTFVAKDSLGRPIDATSKAYVRFSVSPSLGGTEFISPSADSTNENGFVTVTFNAGTKAGVVQMLAKTTAPGRPDTIYSTPVRLTISGGLPDSNQVIVTLSKVNMPGLVKTGPVGTVNVQAGDKYNNPVQAGTAFYFTTSMGLIQASATTSDAGQTSVQLSGGVLGTPSGSGTVTVQTVGENGVAIVKNVPFLFTGAPLITGAPYSGFTISDSGAYSFSFKVADVNGNPLSAGAAVSVSVSGPGSGDLELSGDITRLLPDSRDTNYTNFTVTASDKSSGGVSGAVTFQVNVTGENGLVSYLFSGTQLASGQTASSVGGSGYGSSILLVSTSPSSPRTISVRGTGANETASLVFVIKDSLGNPIGLSRADTVLFTIEGGPGGGAYLNPTSAISDAYGQVSTTLSSGTVAGVLQIRATATILSRTIQSSPVAFTIAGGLPVASRFTVWSDAQNYNGLVNPNLLGTITVQLGDTYGNPVQDGTAVYFSTTGGMIQSSAFTVGGFATQSLFGGGNPPVGGINTITVKTVDETNTQISKQLDVTFSGAPVITPLNASNDTVIVLDGSFFDLSYRVADANGNPLAAGNSVLVSVSSLTLVANDLALTGDFSFATTDTRLTSTTNQLVRVRDLFPDGGNSGTFALKIAVSGPNGSATRTLVGILGAPGQVISSSPSLKFPASIAYIGVSASDIFISGVGALEQAVITYEVRDSTGTPLDAANKAYAEFSVQFFPNTFAGNGTSPRLLKLSDSTDDAGRLNVQVISGTQAGVVQVTVRILVGSNYVIASPVKITVHAGFPDQSHFTVIPEGFNFPGLDNIPGYANSPDLFRNTILVQVADTFSNPVQLGTAVYFNSTHGTITQELTTDVKGFISNFLYPSNPRPEGAYVLPQGAGHSFVYARTIGQGGVFIKDSVELLWTGKPIVSLTSGPASFAIADGATGGPWEFTVADRLGNPMSNGTIISVTSGDGLLAGNANVTLSDEITGGAGITSFIITVSDSDPGDTDDPAPTLLTVTIIHPAYGTTSWVIASGTIN
ncbi:MAG TPA: hypothetical protein DCX46_12995 [Bacteroidetes bacterium]|nr:hypothetical protein [Bacteroidota bacterium]